jgi:hypothetical protein
MGATGEDLPNLRTDGSLPKRITVSFRDPSGRVVVADGRAFVIERNEQVGDSNRWLYQMRRSDLA